MIERGFEERDNSMESSGRSPLSSIEKRVVDVGARRIARVEHKLCRVELTVAQAPLEKCPFYEFDCHCDSLGVMVVLQRLTCMEQRMRFLTF